MDFSEEFMGKAWEQTTGIRMLPPRELYNPQGFPADYIIDRGPDGGKISQKDQVARCGNSVCPTEAYALVKANAKGFLQNPAEPIEKRKGPFLYNGVAPFAGRLKCKTA